MDSQITRTESASTPSSSSSTNDKLNETLTEHLNKDSNDSPAFRLRPRRSTPRKCDQSISSINVSANKRYALYRSDLSDKKLRYSLAKPTKRMLFPVTESLSKSDHIISKILGTNVTIEEPTDESQESFDFAQKVLTNKQSNFNPSSVVLDNVELGVFAEQLSLKHISQHDINKGGYYVSVRVVHVCDANESIQIAKSNRVLFDSSHSLNQTCTDELQTQISLKQSHQSTLFDSSSASNENQDCLIKSENANNSNGLSCVNDSNDTRLLRLLVQETDRANFGPLWRPKQPLLLLVLHGVYADAKDNFKVGKILELVRFEHESIDPDSLHFEHHGQKMQFWPFMLHMRLNLSQSWLPLISVRDRIEPLDESNLIVQNGQNIKQTTSADDVGTNNDSNNSDRKDAMRFSSYVVKVEDPTQTVSLQQTKSPTIKRFMKTISSAVAINSNDKSPIKIKIKRNLS